MSNPKEDIVKEIEQVEIEPIPENKKKKSIMPIFLISGLIHSIIILILLFVIVASAKQPKEDIIITTAVVAQVEEEDPPQEKRTVIKEKVEVTVETESEVQPVVTNEEVSDHMETDNNMEAATAEGTSEGISDSPQVGSGLMGNIGGGGGGGGSFGNRMGGGKKKAIMKGGGSEKTESSVDAALKWLMRHQEKDGHWDSVKNGNNTPFRGTDHAMSGLATLAFLAAGHTPKIGKYKDTVKTAVNWIMAQQDADGSFTIENPHCIYDNAICALALVETYAMLPDPKIKVAAQKAVDYLGSTKIVHWGLTKDGTPASMSVLGWMMMTFKSAKIAGLNIPDDVFKKYRARIDELADKDQSGNIERVHYAIPGDRTNDVTYGKDVMSAIGMLVYLYLGVKRVELEAIANNLLKELPAIDANINSFDLYRWYYATLALFQFGGEQWKKWNKSLIETLTGTQRKGGPLDGSAADVDGSWDPSRDRWGAGLGRVYTTAMGAFCLEVYYRYESVLH